MYESYGIDMPRSSLSAEKKVGTGAKMPGVKRRVERGLELVVPLEVIVRGKRDVKSVLHHRRRRDLNKGTCSPEFQPPRTARGEYPRSVSFAVHLKFCARVLAKLRGLPTNRD